MLADLMAVIPIAANAVALVTTVARSVLPLANVKTVLPPKTMLPGVTDAFKIAFTLLSVKTSPSTTVTEIFPEDPGTNFPPLLAIKLKSSKLMVLPVIAIVMLGGIEIPMLAKTDALLAVTISPAAITPPDMVISPILAICPANAVVIGTGAPVMELAKAILLNPLSFNVKNKGESPLNNWVVFTVASVSLKVDPGANTAPLEMSA